MDIKKVITIGALLTITACTERNKEYYEANIDEAEAKANQCEESMEAAFNAEDEKKLEALSKDAECNFAVNVYNDHKRKLARIKREAEKRQLEKERIEEEKLFKKKYEEKLISLKELPYAEFQLLNKECGARFLSKKSPECSAYSDLRDEVETREINVLKEKYSGGKLEEFRDTSCKGVNYAEAVCALSRKAARQQHDELVEFYVSNRDELKTEFNKCQATYDSLRKSNKWKEANDSIQTYLCGVVGKAASKLKVYNFNKPIG